VGGGVHWEYLLHTKPAMATALGRFLRRWNPRDRVIRDLERRAFAPGACRKVLCVSGCVREEIRRHYGVPDETLAVLHNGVDIRRFSPDVRAERRRDARGRLALSDGETAVLFAGTGYERKGLRFAVEAVGLVAKDAPVRLLVAGRGAAGPSRRLARRLGIAERVRFLGEASDIESLYAAADVFLLPTLYDPFPNACLEAMACGLPVVTTAAAGVSEIIESGVDAWSVDSGDRVVELAAALRDLLDPARRDAMGRAARAKAERHSLERHLERTLAIYDEVLKAKRKDGAAAGGSESKSI
jgi:UDP-glucose:(heptosyl)LPS alpha-1,3-glucosyltransferase